MKNLNGAIQSRKANLKSTNNETLTFTMISDVNDGVRHSWSGESYIERLDVNGAKFDELRTFFKNHNRDVDSAIGRIENVRVEDSTLVGDVVFDESGADIKRKYQNGTLTDVSIGYRIKDYKVEERKGELDLVTVTDFDVIELSAVGIGFDSGAKKRNLEGDKMLEGLNKRLSELEAVAKRTDEQNSELEKVRKDIEVARVKEIETLRAEKIEAERKAEIMTIATKYNASSELRAKFEEKGSSEEFMRAILDERKAEQPNVSVSVGNEQTRESMLEAMSDAITLNSGIRLENPHKDVDIFRGASLIDIAKKVTETGGYNRDDIASRAMVNADFPLLLISSGNRILESNYAEQNGTYQAWVKETELPDFRTQTNITLGDTGRLSKLQENGEFKEKQLTEASEDWKIESFGAEFTITRQMIINDDLNAFTGLLGEFGKMAKRTANGIVYDLLQAKNDYASYTMKDGIAIFHTDHSNLAGTGAALSATTLEAARTSMMRQTSVSGNPLNIMPKYLIIAPEQEITARTLLSSTASTEANTNNGVINPFYNMLQIIVDSELTAGAWYLAGDMRTIKAGYLAGTGRRPIVKMDTQSLTKTVFQGVFDFGVVAEDYKSLYKNAGA
jgi:phage head maturation protease